MRKLAMVSVVVVAAMAALLGACGGQDELNPREEALATGSEALVSHGVVPRVRLGRVALPTDLRQATVSSSSSDAGDSLGFLSLIGLGAAGSAGASAGMGSPGLSGGVGAPSTGSGGPAGAPSSGIGGVAGGPSTGVGGVAGGPGAVAAAGGDLGRSLCGFMSALCDKLVECAGQDLGDEVCGIFQSAECVPMINDALAEAGGDVAAIPPEAIRSIDCLTVAIQSMSCSGFDGGDIGAFQSCGISG